LDQRQYLTKALESAAQTIIDLFTLLINNKNTNENNQLETKTQSVLSYTNIAIEELQLSVRAYNCLKKAQINTVGDYNILQKSYMNLRILAENQQMKFFLP
jgi:DNA-directed RNA polymerase alpha subunit